MSETAGDVPAPARPGEAADDDETTVYHIDGTGDHAWLVAEVGGCTCAGGGEWPHEAHCGLEPIAQIHTLRDAVHGAAAVRADERAKIAAAARVQADALIPCGPYWDGYIDSLRNLVERLAGAGDA